MSTVINAGRPGRCRIVRVSELGVVSVRAAGGRYCRLAGLWVNRGVDLQEVEQLEATALDSWDEIRAAV